MSQPPRFSASQQAIIHRIATAGPVSRTELARALGLGKPALTALSRDLIAAGLVRETAEPPDPRRQGRPATLLSMNPDYGCFGGVSVDAAGPALVLVDLDGNMVASRPLRVEREPERFADAVAEALAAVPGARPLGLGIAVSGLVDATRRVCVTSAALGWHGIPLADMIETRTGLRTLLENDANAVAVGESLFGPARGHDDFAVVTIGDTIGGAIHAGGRLRRGAGGGAGEIAHATAEPDGPPCKCGRRGCLDVVASRAAMLGEAAARGLGVRTMDDLERLAGAGEREALDVLHRAGTALGRAIADLVQIVDPGLVLILDTAGAMGTLMRTITERTIAANVLPALAGGLDIVHMARPEPDLFSQSAASVAALDFFVAGSER